jgi:N utilization substance protein B
MSRQRSMARKRAVQALYQWHLSGTDLVDIDAQFLLEYNMAKAEAGYFKTLFHGVAKNSNELDTKMIPLLDRPIQEVDPIERAIIRLGIFELQYCMDVPYKVVINEAVNLTKTYGAQDGYKYVNSILDGAAKILRKTEINLKKAVVE